jgi:anti-sigma B factor antagonist
MRIEDRQLGDVLVVKPLEQALDAYGAVSFREQVAAFIEQGRRQIVLDLADVHFLDSTGLGAIVSSLKKLDGRGVMVICNVGEMVMDVFRLTRMDRVFPIVRTVEDAVVVARENPRRAA